MLKKIKEKIQNFIKQREQHKYDVVYRAWLGFYEIRHNHLKPVDFLPPVLAKQQMKYICAAGELNTYYKMVMATSRKGAINE